jgi:hypothetical protein
MFELFSSGSLKHWLGVKPALKEWGMSRLSLGPVPSNRGSGLRRRRPKPTIESSSTAHHPRDGRRDKKRKAVEERGKRLEHCSRETLVSPPP